jgi:hypothetical protein
MTHPAEAGDRHAAATDYIRQIRQQFETAWQHAVAGGEQPSLEAFLADSAEAERWVLRQELEPIDQTYRQTFRIARAATLTSCRPRLDNQLLLDRPAQTPPSI